MSYTANQSTPANGAEAIYNLLVRLLAAGWTVLSSSDGTTYNSSGNQLSSGSSGAGGLNNTSAWVRVQSPYGAGGTQWIFQRRADAATWTIQRSRAGFSGGTPDATTLPTASDTITLVNNAAFFESSPGRWNVCCDNAAPYGWHAFEFATGGGNPRTLLMHDPLAAGSYNAADADPVVSVARYTTGTFTTEWAAQGNSNAQKRVRRGLSSERTDAVGYWTYGDVNLGQVVPPGTGPGTDPYDSSEDVLPTAVGKRGASGGYCGFSTLHRWSTIGRTTGDTLQVGSEYWICVGASSWLRWDSSTPLV